MNRFDTSMKSYQIALESFSSMSLDQPARDRLSYKRAAMEAVTGPDSGMVLDRLYKNVMGRASINFGKIPESAGDLTKFTKYKSLADMLTLLDRQLAEYNIKEVKLAHELHDDIIRCREDFMYGFKVDSQFLKTTYNTMVYSLCELLNLCAVIYIDMLKDSSEGKQFTYEPYNDLLLIQNIEKFTTMVKSGEWARMMLTIRKDAKNLLSVVYNDNSGNGSMMHALAGIVGTAGIGGMAMKALEPRVNSMPGGTASIANYGKAAKAVAKEIVGTTGGKIAIVIVSIIGVLFIIRGLLMAFYRGAYKLNDVLEDNERFLKAHMDNYADPSGTSKSLEKQKWMYNQLSGLQDTIRTKILKSDAEGRKLLKESNAKDFSAAAFKADAEAAASADSGNSDDISIG